MNNTKYIYIALFFLAAFISLIFYTQIQASPLNLEKSTHELKTLLLEKSFSNSEAIQPISENSNIDMQKVLLGKKLFNDPKLSNDSSVSCASCHNLTLGGADQKALSLGANHHLTHLNTPTIFNAVYNFNFFWDGRTANFTEQINNSLFAEDQMGNTDWNKLLNYLNNSKEYLLLFKNQYNLPIESHDLLDALSEYSQSLITPNSRFDLYLKGDNFALNTYELEGYRLFKTIGCISCHQGINMGGNMFQKIGLFNNLSNQTDPKIDGNFDVIDTPTDKIVYKVPTLRNIALTAPYFHDGSTKTLEAAVAKMAKLQLGTELSTEDVNKITAFLNSLTGEYHGQPL
ncbi:cytochrome-c peroxidase [Thiomicrorhabdus sp.]|uniref:cytochrome-c peroxidase n=1 Tax=Thiomicrorhabdus sp. TaxID=2039724 RepID=UPI002AA73D94|nr:cytochrome c peroxidase [Thiomicrorhabdus sp.]